MSLLNNKKRRLEGSRFKTNQGKKLASSYLKNNSKAKGLGVWLQVQHLSHTHKAEFKLQHHLQKGRGGGDKCLNFIFKLK
jgi:hypothetical protein